jgi:putative molybdopterin biosynthesis protein
VKRFFSQLSLSDAVAIITSSFTTPQRTEITGTAESAGRIAALPIFAPETIPSSRIAAMDGIAIRSTDTGSASDREPAIITDVLAVCTGQEVPERFDAVIPFEEMEFLPGNSYQVRKPALRFQHIREPGEEVRQGQLILRPGDQIAHSDIGALLTYGIRTVTVRSLIVGLIPTGDELVSGDTIPACGQVRESNTAMIASALTRMGVKPVRYPVVRDDPGLLREAIRTAHEESDIVIVSAGSSSGKRDHTREVIKESGTILFHGVAMRPGKTVLCGSMKGKPVIGLPGQPVAAYTAWREIVLPLLASWGFHAAPDQECTAKTGEAVPGNGGIDEFVPVSVVRINSEDIILPRPRGAAGQMQMIQSNGIIHIPAKLEGFPEGVPVRVRIIRRYHPGSEILFAGRSDLVVDRIRAMLPDTGYQVIIRTASQVAAATLLCKGTCHGIILAESDLTGNSGVARMLGAGCQGRIAGIGMGYSAGERMILVYRITPGIGDEIAPFIRFLSSEIWQKQKDLPDGYSPVGAGIAVQIPGLEGIGMNTTESVEKIQGMPS